MYDDRLCSIQRWATLGNAGDVLGIKKDKESIYVTISLSLSLSLSFSPSGCALPVMRDQPHGRILAFHFFVACSCPVK